VQNPQHAMKSHADLERLRAEVRAWLQDNVPKNWRAAMTGTKQEAFVALQRDWFARLVQAGYATPHWPAGWPGTQPRRPGPLDGPTPVPGTLAPGSGRDR